MSDDEIRRAILRKLYELFMDHGKAAGFKTVELAHDLDIDVEVIEKQMRALKALGLADRIGQVNFRITEDGIMDIEGRDAPNPSATHVYNSIEVSGGSVGNINQAHIINSPSQFLTELAEAIEKHPDIDPEKKKTWAKTLWEISKHPHLPALIEAVKQLVPGLAP